MNTLTLVFLAAVAVTLLARLWLAQRQIRHVQANAGTVPPFFQDRLPLEAHRKAALYTISKARFSRLELIYGTVILLLWTLGGGLDLLDRLWRAAGLSDLLTGLGVMLSFALFASLLSLPASYYHTFGIDQRFGLNNSSRALFVMDFIKTGLLLLILGVPLLWVLLWLMEQSGPFWWVEVWLVWTLFNLLLLWAFPRFIAPLFNKFTPLEDDSLRARIEGLLKKCGFSSNGVFVMDGSRRSTQANAYFSGMGNNKRIVFFDTLLNTLAPPEIEAVLAHELGHFRLHHIRQRILISSIVSLAGLAVLSLLMEHEWFFHDLGVTRPSNHMALLLFLLVAPVFAFLFQPLVSWYSRRHEFEADEYAAQHSSADDLVNALVKLYKENASTLTPDPLYSAMYDSHPPASTRVERLAARGSGSPAQVTP
jgi:STE24 endopeptidase